MNVASLAEDSLRRFGDFEAIWFDGRTFTATELHERSARLAQGLAGMGLQAGDRVLLVLPNGPDVVIAHTAALRAGGCPILYHPSSAVAEIDHVLRHSGATAIVTSAHLAPALATVTRGLRIRVAVGDPLDGWRALESLVTESPPLAVAVARAPDDLALIVYTSGTTSRPKGVPQTHGMVAARLRVHAARYELQRKQRGPGWTGNVLLMVLPLAGSFGTDLLIQRLMTRMKMIILPEFDAGLVLAAIARHRVTVAPLVPSMCEALLASPELGRHDLSSLEAISVGGAPVPPGLVAQIEAKLSIRPAVAYGLTEVAGVTLHVPGCKPGSVGRLMPGVDARVMSEDGRVLPNGEVGEIQVKSPWMMRGYYGEAETDRITDGWMRTGDLGYLDVDRELFIVGRDKDMISQGGVKVYAGDVVTVLGELPGVRESAVVGVPNAFLGEEVVACVVRADAALTAEQVIAHCRDKMDTRKAPVAVYFLDALPRTAFGKVRPNALVDEVRAARAAVRETALGVRLRKLDGAARRDALRDALTIEAARICRAAVDPSAALGDQGLDSLGAVQLANTVGELLGRPFPPMLAFNHPTLDAITDHALHELFGAAEPPRAATRARDATREPIAIVGVACRLPGGIETPQDFWSALRDGRDLTAEVTNDRFPIDEIYDARRGTPGKTYVRRAALLADPAQFDAELFDLSPREAAALDPQHRLLLECTWEALESAGRNPRANGDALVGAFFGITGSSYDSPNPLGVLACMAAGRVSHMLDLHGPSLAIDTACSSSLVSIHTAMQSLRRGESDTALAGGVHVMCSPNAFIGLAAAQALAGDGRCKSFDASADGFGQGEGCVVYVLRRLDDAVRDRDPILGVLRGSAINHDGHAASLAAPSGPAQEAVIRAALDDAGVRPDEIDYLEAHGTGTVLGDPIEIEAATKVLGAGREGRLVVGSVKSNIGHLSAAAGAAGLLKTLLCFEHDALPANLHLEKLNPLLEPFAARFEVPTSLRPWPRTSTRRRKAGVMSMGLSGTNAHVIVEEPPAMEASAPTARPLLCLSAVSDDALTALAGRYVEHLGTLDDRAYAELCFTTNTGRAPMRHRFAIAATSAARAEEKLLSLARGEERGRASLRRGARPRVAMLFTGQGAQYVGMGRRAYETEPLFRRALHRCAEVLQPHLPRPLLDVMFSEAPSGALTIDDTGLAQPALFALEWSLYELWRSWGVTPSLVAGHSLGEYVAATVAGSLSLEDGLALAALRGRLMQALPRDGAMSAIAASEEEVREVLRPHAEKLSIAAVNGPRATVISGERAAVAEVTAIFTGRGTKARALKVSHAFHSALMDPILDELERAVRAVPIAEPHLALASTLTGGSVSKEITEPAYWRRQLREGVRFADAMGTAIAQGCTVFLEIGPQPVLLGMGQSCVGPEVGHVDWIGSLRRDRDDAEQLHEALGALFTGGVELDWTAVYADNASRRVRAPTYPFQRQRYWASFGKRVPRRAEDSARPRRAPTLRQRLLSASPEARRSELEAALRRVLAPVLGRSADSLTNDEDLVHAGLDSLRVMDLLGELRRRLELELSPAELLAHPSIASFAAHLTERLGPATAASGRATLVPLQKGDGEPLFCIHPSGGQVTPYLRLAQLFEGRTVYAIESRAVGGATDEHATIGAMAAEYADLVESADPAGPYHLCGWSMGGVVAYAVAEELERRGRTIARVIMIAPPSGAASPSARHELAFAVEGALHEIASKSPQIAAALRTLLRNDVALAGIHAWCRNEGILDAAVEQRAFDAMVKLRLDHFALVRAFSPSTVHADLLVAWDHTQDRRDWSRHTRGELEQLDLEGDHFAVILPPYIERVVARVRALG